MASYVTTACWCCEVEHEAVPLSKTQREQGRVALCDDCRRASCRIRGQHRPPVVEQMAVRR